MARPTKTLAAHLRDGSFRAHRHEELLAGPLVGAPKLQALQDAWKAAGPRARREIAIAYARAVRDGGVNLGSPNGTVNGNGSSPIGAPGGVATFFAENFVHTKGPAAGRPFALEPWQAAFVEEFYRLDAEGRRIYRLGILGVPRGNGKSPLAAGLGLYELAHRPDAPDVFVAAGGREQARITFNFARAFVEGGPLIERFQVGRNEIVHPTASGSMRVLSAEGTLQHGLQPSAAIVDEVWGFTTAKQVELWTSLETALHKRVDSYLLAITTAGFDRGTILGKMYGAAVESLELERPHSCLTIGRDEEAGVLFWWYAAPEGADVADEAIWRACNPASWVDLRDLRRHRASPSMDESTFRRLHLNQWTSGAHAWILPEVWAACRGDEEISEGAEVMVGVDVGIVHDSTAVAWAHRLDDGRVIVRAEVFSAVESAPAHRYHSGGRVDLGEVEEFIRDLTRRYAVREVIYDPRFFERSADLLSQDGLTVAELAQNSSAMVDTFQSFYQAAREGTIIHDGDHVLRAHVEGAAADQTERGWRVRKLRATARIDACVAACMAHYRAAQSEAPVYVMALSLEEES